MNFELMSAWYAQFFLGYMPPKFLGDRVARVILIVNMHKKARVKRAP